MNNEKCCMLNTEKNKCDALTEIHEGCGTAECPFYKPEGCKKWIRFIHEDKVYVAPPESRYRKNEWIKL